MNSVWFSVSLLLTVAHASLCGTGIVLYRAEVPCEVCSIAWGKAVPEARGTISAASLRGSFQARTTSDHVFQLWGEYPDSRGTGIPDITFEFEDVVWGTAASIWYCGIGVLSKDYQCHMRDLIYQPLDFCGVCGLPNAGH
jgi:hypothetical protein